MRIYHPQVCTGSASPSLPGLAVSATQDLVNSQMGNGEKNSKKISPEQQDQTGTQRGAGAQPGELGGISGARCSGSSCTAH